ncbi:MAG: hypothetical protein HOV66_23065 [Streptomycetaceae bacterium]|nr:hypothetical protein [Streptomycetaceae bacterium]NUS57710.1 hypothetical protein [Streptomycetaceae bacterium]
MSTVETSPAAAPAAGRADLAIRVGAIVFAVGTLAVLVTLTPFLIGAHPLPRAVYLLSLLMPLGFAVAMGGLFAAARGQRRKLPA